MAGSGNNSGGIVLLFGVTLLGMAGGIKYGTSQKPPPKERIVYFDEFESSGAAGFGTGGGQANAGNQGPPAPYDPNMPGGPAGPGEGANRQWRGYVQTDVEALRGQLPPQAQHLAESFIAAGQQYNMDPLFLASISYHETGGWTSNAFYNRNNAMGVSNASGVIDQASHGASINRMAASLAGAQGTAGYYNGANTVGQVGAIYAPIGAANDPNGLNNYWASGVGSTYDRLNGAIR